MLSPAMQAAFDTVEAHNTTMKKSLDEMRAILEPKLQAVGRRVLVCDDSDSIRILLRRTLESIGYEVTEAVDGEECLKKVSENNVGLVLLDMNMPKLNGREVLNLIGKAKFRTVVVSAMAEEEATTFERATGVQVIRKPFGLDQIRDIVRKILPRA